MIFYKGFFSSPRASRNYNIYLKTKEKEKIPTSPPNPNVKALCFLRESAITPLSGGMSGCLMGTVLSQCSANCAAWCQGALRVRGLEHAHGTEGMF